MAKWRLSSGARSSRVTCSVLRPFSADRYLATNLPALLSPVPVEEALKFADFMGRGRIRVLVPNGSTCASACFFMFAAAPYRMVGQTARIGVHSVSIGGQEDAATLATTAAVHGSLMPTASETRSSAR